MAAGGGAGGEVITRVETNEPVRLRAFFYSREIQRASITWNKQIFEKDRSRSSGGIFFAKTLDYPMHYKSYEL